jgi:hypothetical protein
MGIYSAPLPHHLIYSSKGNTLNTTLPLKAGTYNTVVEEWDYCGSAAFTPVKIVVTP